MDDMTKIIDELIMDGYVTLARWDAVYGKFDEKRSELECTDCDTCDTPCDGLAQADNKE